MWIPKLHWAWVALPFLVGCGQDAETRVSVSPAEVASTENVASALSPSGPAPTTPVNQPSSHHETAPERVRDATRTERAPLGAPTAGQQVHIPAGSMRVGSQPGEAERRPAYEADLVSLPMDTYNIDRLPYPNDPGRDPLLVTSRREAVRHCRAEGRRLCGELEWERACKGAENHRYPTGDTLDLASCQSPDVCASAWGVLQMGLDVPEWTSSDAEGRLARFGRSAIVRGGRRQSDLTDHRCAARYSVAPEAPRALAFRCCDGESPSPNYPDVGLRRLFRDPEWSTEQLREILASVPQLARYAANFLPASREDGLRAFARGSVTEEQVPWELAPGPFAWSPSPGEEVWLIHGQSGEHSLIAALYPMPDGRTIHAGSFIFENEEAPLALLRTRTERNEIRWTTCWACAGENGVVRFDERAQISISQE